VGTQASFVDQDHERRCAAVQDRHLRTIDLHQRVVDPQAVQRGEQVLDRLDRDPFGAERRGVIQSREVCEPGRDRHPHVAPEELEAVPRRRGLQAKTNRLPRVKSDTGASDFTFQRPAVGHSR
jgi:hypothetical protein